MARGAPSHRTGTPALAHRRVSIPRPAPRPLEVALSFRAHRKLRVRRRTARGPDPAPRSPHRRAARLKDEESPVHQRTRGGHKGQARPPFHAGVERLHPCRDRTHRVPAYMDRPGMCSAVLSIVMSSNRSTFSDAVRETIGGARCRMPRSAVSAFDDSLPTGRRRRGPDWLARSSGQVERCPHGRLARGAVAGNRRPGPWLLRSVGRSHAPHAPNRRLPPPLSCSFLPFP